MPAKPPVVLPPRTFPCAAEFKTVPLLRPTNPPTCPATALPFSPAETSISAMQLSIADIFSIPLSAENESFTPTSPPTSVCFMKEYPVAVTFPEAEDDAIRLAPVSSAAARPTNAPITLPPVISTFISFTFFIFALFITPKSPRFWLSLSPIIFKFRISKPQPSKMPVNGVSSLPIGKNSTPDKSTSQASL